MLRENVLTVVKARRTGADESLRNLTFTLGDYISIQQYDDPDLRLKQIILKNFERGTLYDVNSIDKVVQTLTVRNFWEQIEKNTKTPAGESRRYIEDLIWRRNQIAHRADRPDEGEEADPLGLRAISFAWTNQRVQTSRTLVTASANLFRRVIKRLEDDIRVAEEQAEARRLAKLG